MTTSHVCVPSQNYFFVGLFKGISINFYVAVDLAVITFPFFKINKKKFHFDLFGFFPAPPHPINYPVRRKWFSKMKNVNHQFFIIVFGILPENPVEWFLKFYFMEIFTEILFRPPLTSFPIIPISSLPSSLSHTFYLNVSLDFFNLFPTFAFKRWSGWSRGM